MTVNTSTTFFGRFITNPLRTAGEGLAAGALGLSLLAGGPVQAQTPLLVGYQGALFDAQGQPAQGSADVDVAIFDAAQGGTQLYAESHPGVPLVDGTFDVQIGAGTSPTGAFDEQTFAGPEAWLELTVDGEVLTPRQRLVAVPYALRARVAESLDGSIGTVPHALTADRLTAAPGADSPSQLLAVHVDEDGVVTGDGANVFFDQTWVDGVNHDALVFEKVDRGTNDPDGSIVFSNRGADNVSEMSMQIDGSGNVGIPVSNPTARFQVDAIGQRAANLWSDNNDMSVYSYNRGTGEAIVAQSHSSTYHRATIRSQNFNTTDGVAGYFRNQSPEATMSVYNFGSGPGLIVRATGQTDVLSAWTRPAAASSSTKEFWVDGTGVTNVRTLKIHGGADLSERFDVATSTDEAVEPGTVVTIDPDGSGRLTVSDEPYSTRVAGIIAGAGGIEPGMVMHQEGVAETEGQHPVALTGRVYAKADASNGPIRPGDLLTTSRRPGHAMRATDSARANGAILGKAMTRLDEETGTVLVLIGLQ
jgi:hypothetical protein